MPVGIAEELHIHRVVAQQVDDHAVLGHRVRQGQGLTAFIEHQQQLLQITEYAVVVGNQRQSTQQPIPVTSPLMIRLKGKSLNKGATIAQVVLNFDAESKSLKKPVFDESSKTLTLSYPVAQYRVIVDLLRSDTVYVQFLSYANGHIWADLHTGAVRAK